MRLHPDPGPSRNLPGAHAQAYQGQQEHRFQLAQVANIIRLRDAIAFALLGGFSQAARSQRQQRVAHNLPRAVIGHIPAAVYPQRLDASPLKLLRIPKQILGLATPPETYTHAGALAAAAPAGDYGAGDLPGQLLLQPPGLFVRHTPQAHYGASFNIHARKYITPEQAAFGQRLLSCVDKNPTSIGYTILKCSIFTKDDVMSNLQQFEKQDYLNLETFRKTGVGVPTPVWFIEDQGVLYVTTGVDSGKVKRIRNNGRVRIAPCDVRGGLKGEWVEAQARLVSGDGVEQKVDRLLGKKYGLQKTLYGLMNRFSRARAATIEISFE